jgi:hypothetical protein
LLAREGLFSIDAVDALGSETFRAFSTNNVAEYAPFQSAANSGQHAGLAPHRELEAFVPNYCAVIDDLGVTYHWSVRGARIRHAEPSLSVTAPVSPCRTEGNRAQGGEGDLRISGGHGLTSPSARKVASLIH